MKDHATIAHHPARHHVVALLIGCAWSTGACTGSHDDPTSSIAEVALRSPASPLEPAEAPTTAAIQCMGRKPTPPVCNTVVCIGDSWEIFPRFRGLSCSSSFGPGECDGGIVVNGNWVLQEGMCIVPVATVDPQYYVLSVVYAPPGHAGAAGQSSVVTYGSGSTLGATTEASQSFKQAATVGVSITLPFAGTEVSFSGGYGKAVVATDSLSITKSTTTTVTATGPAADGVNHDEDRIYLWLNPRVNIAAAGTLVQWTFAVNPAPPFGNIMDIQFVKVGQLKGTLPMAPGLRAELEARGITPDRYADLLSYDPFAMGGTVVDPLQFVQTTTSFPYEPPTSPDGISDSFQLSLTNSVVSTNSVAKTIERTVGLSISSGFDWLSVKLKASQQWTWTQTNKRGTSTGTTEAATALVKGPSFGYTGPTNMAVYYDTVYKTFLFRPIVIPAALSGAVIDDHRQPMAHQPVSLTIDGVTYRSITNRDGEYRFFGIPSGAGVLRANAAAARPVIIDGNASGQRVDLAP